MEFEDILDQVGGYGAFQKRLAVFFIVPLSCLLPVFWMNSLFMVSVPDHWCYVPELVSSNLSEAQKRALVSPPGDPSCSMYNRDYSLYQSIGSLEEVNDTADIVPCYAGWEYDKTDFDFTASSQFDLVCERKHFPSLLLTLQNVGSLIGTPFYGFLSDRFGRRTVYLILGIVILTTELLSVLSTNFITFAILRTLSGTTRPSLFLSSSILITELVSPDMRAHMTGLFNCFWTIGYCILPVAAYFSRNWIALALMSAGASATFVLHWFHIPESPCWLVSRRRYEDAARIMLNIAEKNGKHHNYGDLLTSLEILGEKIEKVKKAEKCDSGSKLIRYPRLRRCFFILAACWAGFLIAYNGLTYNVVNLNGNIFLNMFLLAVVEVPGNFIFWYFMDRAGRRWTAAFGNLATGLVCLIPLIDFPLSDIVGSLAGKLMISGVVMVSDQQSSELFPTVIRSSCIGTTKTIGTFLSMMSPYVAYISIYGKEIPFIIISLTCFVIAALSAFLPETLNKRLPSTITDAEEFGKNEKFFSWNTRVNLTPPATIAIISQNEHGGTENEPVSISKNAETEQRIMKV